MARGKSLSEYERGQIDVYHEKGLSNRQIAIELKRWPSVINNYLNDPHNYGQNHRGGRPQVMDERTKRAVFRDISNTGESINKIKGRNGVKASKSTIWRQLKDNKNIKFMKRKCRPNLKERHITARLAWAKNHFNWSTEWHKIIFSDEKKFNLDGPDGFQYYWHDLRKEEKWYSKKVCGGGRVMVWGAIGYNGKTNLAIIDTRNNGQKYVETLETHLLPFAERIAGENWQFQQDYSSIHTSKVVQEWFTLKNIESFDWVSLSADLNIIENVWGYLVRTVYANGKQYNKVEDLKLAILEAWDDLDQDYIRKLFDSMPKRLFELVLKKGNKIDY